MMAIGMLFMLAHAGWVSADLLHWNMLLFAFLSLFFGREIFQDLQAASMDRLQLGAHLAHALMSGMMCWMLLEMIAMTMAMRG